MADIHIHRTHALGLAKARKMAWKWAEATAFDLTARLGTLLGAFSGKIDSEIEAQLDKLLPRAAFAAKRRKKV